jgi:hypothetical protein
MYSKTKQTVLFSLLAVVSSLLTADPLATDRPGASDSSSVVMPGFAQIEIGIKGFEDANDDTGLETGNTVFRVGVMEDWELQLGWGGYLDAEPGYGWNDGLLGFKYAISAGEDSVDKPEMAAIVQTTVPFGSSDVSSDKFDPKFLLLCTHKLNEEFFLTYNLGLGVATTEKADGRLTTQSSGLYTFLLGYSATEQLSFFTELYGQIGLSADDSPFLFDCGLAYLLDDNSQLDFSVGAGLNSEAENFFVSLGYSLRWGTGM